MGHNNSSPRLHHTRTILFCHLTIDREGYTKATFVCVDWTINGPIVLYVSEYAASVELSWQEKTEGLEKNLSQ